MKAARILAPPCIVLVVELWPPKGKPPSRENKTAGIEHQPPSVSIAEVNKEIDGYYENHEAHAPGHRVPIFTHLLFHGCPLLHSIARSKKFANKIFP